MMHGEHKKKIVLTTVALFFAAATALTLIWNRGTIAQKFSQEEYFKEEFKSEENDIDGDGIANDQEEKIGTDSMVKDTDGDGLNDGEEINSYRTNPLASDTDGDAFSDSTEISKGYDPNKSYLEGKSESSSSAMADGGANAEAPGLKAIDGLLNGGNESLSGANLQDLGLSDFTDLNSLLDVELGSQEIVITDSDLNIVEVEEEAAKDAIVQYAEELQLSMMDIFGEDIKNPDETKSTLSKAVGGQFELFDRPSQQLAMFSDKLIEMRVPSQAKNFHKKFVSFLLEMEGFSRGLYKLNEDPSKSLMLLTKMNKLEEGLAKSQEELKSLSETYELGMNMDLLKPYDNKVEDSKDK